LLLSRKFNRKIDMNDKTPVHHPRGNVFRSENTCHRADAQLAPQELERVVGGYIGETEKNLGFRSSNRAAS
jgi:hypothetical protein